MNPAGTEGSSSGRADHAGPYTRTRMLHLLGQRLRAGGVEVPGFLRRFGLAESVEHDEESIVSLATLGEAFHVASSLLREPSLGLAMAAQYQRGSFGLLEYTFRYAPTLREACRRVVRYVGLTNDLVQMTFEEGKSEARIRHWINGHPPCLGQHPNEFFMALLVRQMRELTGQRIMPESVWFAHAAPSDLGALVAAFGTAKLSFSAEANGLALSTDALTTALPAADPALLMILDQVASEKLTATPPTGDFSLQVRRSIRERITGTLPKMSVIAATFHMSERTFQRRLGKTSASYQSLVDSVREELARRHVAESKLSFGEIAYLLGYAELTAFLRAFKRWVGVTPQQYRLNPAAAPPAALPAAPESPSD